MIRELKCVLWSAPAAQGGAGQKRALAPQGGAKKLPKKAAKA